MRYAVNAYPADAAHCRCFQGDSTIAIFVRDSTQRRLALPLLRIARMAGLRDHTAFDVWKLSDEVRRRVRVVLKRPEFRREFKLRDQLSSAAEGPCGHLAEGFSRWFPKDFARFVRIAKGSLSEVMVHIERAHDSGLVTDADCAEITRYARRARGAATRLILYLESADPPTRNQNDPERGNRNSNSSARDSDESH